MRTVTRTAALILVCHAFADCKRHLTCDDCHIVCDFLQRDLGEAPPQVSHDDLVGEVRPRRHLPHARSETEIFREIDSVCDKVLIEAVSDSKVYAMPRLHRWQCCLLPCQNKSVLQHLLRKVLQAADGMASGFSAPCKRLMQQQRSALENHIFASGVTDLRRVFCSELTDLCRPVDLHDHGEL